MEVTCSSETLVGFQWIARYYVPEDRSGCYSKYVQYINNIKQMPSSKRLPLAVRFNSRFTLVYTFQNEAVRCENIHVM
jgi:hypothetical protein